MVQNFRANSRRHYLSDFIAYFPFLSHCSLSSKRATGPSSCELLGRILLTDFTLHLFCQKDLLCHTSGICTTFSTTTTPAASNFATTLLGSTPFSDVQSIKFQVHKYMDLSGILLHYAKFVVVVVLFWLWMLNYLLIKGKRKK